MPTAKPKEPVPALDVISLEERVTEFVCPRCPEVFLQVGNLFGTQVCTCSSCHGFVIDRNSLGELVETLRANYQGADEIPQPANVKELDEHNHCPACLDRMETFRYCGPGNVVLDSCNLCNLAWFDEGELRKVVRAPGQRDYTRKTNFESDFLRRQLMIQSQRDGAASFYLHLLGV